MTSFILPWWMSTIRTILTTSSDGVVAALENLKVCSFCYHNSFVPLAGYRWQGPLWLIDHLHRTKEAYIQTTKPSSVMSPDLLVQTLSMLSSSGRNGGQCNECQKTVPINLICLQQRIEAALKVRMATVSYSTFPYRPLSHAIGLVI